MSKVSYDELAINGLRDVLQQVSKACGELDIDFFVVGAIARNIWFASHGEKVSGTKDIDFGIYVPSEKKYYELRQKLIEEYLFRENSYNQFCLFSPNGKPVDLLPFGEIETEGKVILEGKGLTSISLDGFKECYQKGLNEAQIGPDIYWVCSIPSILILKFIAFDDRPTQRIKDVKDINSICHHYPDIESEHIWSNHFDLYDGDREHHEVAMIVLGREIKKIIESNPNLKKRVLNIIDRAISTESAFVSHMIEDPESETVETKAKLLRLIKQGLLE